MNLVMDLYSNITEKLIDDKTVEIENKGYIDTHTAC